MLNCRGQRQCQAPRLYLCPLREKQFAKQIKKKSPSVCDNMNKQLFICKVLLVYNCIITFFRKNLNLIGTVPFKRRLRKFMPVFLWRRHSYPRRCFGSFNLRERVKMSSCSNHSCVSLFKKRFRFRPLKLSTEV